MVEVVTLKESGRGKNSAMVRQEGDHRRHSNKRSGRSLESGWSHNHDTIRKIHGVTMAVVHEGVSHEVVVTGVPEVVEDHLGPVREDPHQGIHPICMKTHDRHMQDFQVVKILIVVVVVAVGVENIM